MDLRDFLILTSVAQIEYGRSATVDEDATVRHAIGVMRSRKVGCLLATEGGVLRGILTERDLIRKVFGPGRSLEVPVHEVMTRNLCIPKTRFPRNHGHSSRRIPSRGVARWGAGMGTRVSVGVVE
jgi:signal-transduction protein with cAMP-binding, CBS, and nucleotidyltransferase domain